MGDSKFQRKATSQLFISKIGKPELVKPEFKFFIWDAERSKIPQNLFKKQRRYQVNIQNSSYETRDKTNRSAT